MKTTGRILSIMRDWKTRKHVIQLQVDDADESVLNDLVARIRLSIELKPYRESRSLSANNYFHKLCDELAKAQDPPVTLDYMKNFLISRYGQRAYKDDGTPMVIKTNIPVEVMLENADLHTWPAKGGDDDTTFLYVFRPTHTYDTKEMSILIDGTIEDCKLYGIDTKPEKELYALLERWGRGKDTSKRAC